VLRDLEQMHKKLQKAEETARRNACLDQLKAIANEVENFLERYRNEAELSVDEIKKSY